MSTRPPITRALLKLSGEILRGEREFGVDPAVFRRIAQEIGQARQLGCQLALVCGGGNIFRGVTGESSGIRRTTGDQIGMLATVANGIAMADFLRDAGMEVLVLSAVEVRGIVDAFDRERAISALSRGTIVICAGGTGNPYFTTDTAGALRAAQLEVEVLLKGTKVDGVYDADPVRDPTAKRFEELSYDEMVSKKLAVMDLTAALLLSERKLPTIVFDFKTPGNLVKVIRGQHIGTRIGSST